MYKFIIPYQLNQTTTNMQFTKMHVGGFLIEYSHIMNEFLLVAVVFLDAYN